MKTWTALAALALLSAALSGAVSQPADAPWRFGLAFSLGFLPLLWIAGRGSLTPLPFSSLRRFHWFVLGVSILCHLLYLPMQASDDLHRYVWEGEAQRAGLNPYSVASTDAGAAAVPSLHRDRVNHPEWTAIYGPGAELAFAALAKGTDPAWRFRMSMMAASLLTAALFCALVSTLKGAPGLAPLFAWNPLLLFSFAGQAHLDAWLVCLLLGGVLMIERKRFAVAAFAIGLAAGVKIVALLCLPCLWIAAPKRWSFAALGVLALLYLPFLDAGPGLLDSLLRFGAEMRFNCSGYGLLLFVGTDTFARAAALASLAGLTVWAVLRRGRTQETAAIVIGGFLFLSPTVHSWYFTWLLPFALLCKPMPALILSWSLIFTLAPWASHSSSGQWREPDWMPWAVYGPVSVCIVITAFHRRRRHRHALSPSQANP